MPISAKKRRSLKKSQFALPSKRAYPIDTRARAKAALRYAARKDTVGSFSTVARKVYARYPDLKPKSRKSKRSKRSKRKRSGRR